MKPYLVDKQPADMDDVINKAKQYGYKEDAWGVLYVSRAAAILRKHGHKVENNNSILPIPRES